MLLTHNEGHPYIYKLFPDAPPILLYSFIEQTLQPGPAVSLKCSASGNPTPQISWTLDGFPLPSHGRLVLFNVNPKQRYVFWLFFLRLLIE